MALLFMEGFDWLDPALTSTALQDQLTSYWLAANLTFFNPQGAVGTGRLGTGNAIILGGQNGSQSITSPILTPNTGETVVGFAVNIAALSTSRLIDFYSPDAVVTAGFRIASSGAILVYENTTLRETTNAFLTAGQWDYVELKFSVSATSPVEIRINGNLAWSSPSVNIDNGKSSWSYFRMHAPGFNSTTEFDDIYVLDTTGASNNDFLGLVNVKTLVPDASGSVNTFTASDASPAADHWMLVDELPGDDDTTYLEGSVSGERELFSYEPSTPIGAVYGVQHLASCRVTDNTARDIRFTTEDGAGISDNSTETVASPTYVFSSIVYDTNPSNGSVWTEATIDATDFGITID